MNARLKATPNLQLLFELEPAHRVFFRNLSDTLLRRSVPAVATGTRPGHFWKDVFVPTGLPWGAFMESMLWHLAVVSVLWTVAQTWVKQAEIQQRRAARESLTYYPPPKKFPALGGRPAPVRERPMPNTNKSPLHVARERSPGTTKPPDLKVASQRPNVIPGLPSSAMPLFAPKLRESAVPAGPANAVAPAPNIKQATTRRPNVPQDAAVAPAANVGSVSSRRAMATPNAAVVPPAPNLPVSTAKLSAARIGNPQVVAPTPRLDARGGISARQSASLSLPHPVVVMPSASVPTSGIPGNGRLDSRVDLPVIPPAPSDQGVGSFSRNKPALSLSGGSAISPAPSLRAAKGLSGGGRWNSLSGRDTVVVPPPPSAGSGASTGGARVESLSGTGHSVIPPPASIGGPNAVAAGKGISVSVGERKAIPPAPSLGGTGNSTGGGRRKASLSGGTQQALPPASSLQDTLSAIEKGTSESGSAASNASAAPSPPALDSGSNIPATIELPIRVIGLAVSLPNSSYFSNYEVFIAERRLKKGTPELIKLVYESLPYQPRLTDYGLDNSKVYRLRVTRDPACDETLLQMTWPQTDEKHSGSKYATGPPALAPSDRNDLLPCYRTTADDYRRAVTQDR